MTQPLVLASSSPFRRLLMQNAGLDFVAQAASIDERAIEAKLAAQNATPETVALELARAKALDVSTRFPDAFVIGSDQTMSLSHRVYHKPASLQEARENLLSLSGQTHHLNSGVAIVRNGAVVWQIVARAAMTVRVLSPDFVDRYLASVGDAVMTSVGAYQLEGEGIRLFESIGGDYFTILGLPMLPLLKALRELGAVND
ncbi:Maf-like protein [Affinirhizobium pseudoryzae]|uniref:Maf-like protein n=1 Tax=Allorhizobium pseudoryzae TaxID=379684 RepID=UPI0013ED967F|nr:Maf-like protein [Allorhizobium pseudoryzae]